MVIHVCIIATFLLLNFDKPMTTVFINDFIFN